MTMCSYFFIHLIICCYLCPQTCLKEFIAHNIYFSNAFLTVFPKCDGLTENVTFWCQCIHHSRMHWDLTNALGQVHFVHESLYNLAPHLELIRVPWSTIVPFHHCVTIWIIFSQISKTNWSPPVTRGRTQRKNFRLQDNCLWEFP